MFLVALLSACFIIIRSYGSEISGEFLKAQIARQTKGNYTVDFTEIQVSLVNKEVRIKDLHLIKKNHANTDTIREAYTILIPKLEIGLESILSIYFGRELIITGIKIHDPQITITKTDDSGKRTSFSLETGSLYNSISEYLSLFSVKNLNIENASVRYKKSTKKKPMDLRVGEIDFSIANFLLDSAASDSNKFFYTDKIELIISNQQFELPDSIHAISFDEFHISTGTGDVLFKNLKLQPLERINTKNLKSFYSIEIPEFNFRGLDFSKAYNEDELSLDSIRILNPIINIQNKTDSKGKGKNLNLLELSTTLFEKFEIGRLYLDNAQVNVTMKQGEHLANYQSSAVNVKISKVHIDSTKTAPSEWMHLFENIEVDANRIFTQVMDSTHQVIVSKLSYSSTEGHIKLDGLEIFPITKIGPERLSLNLHLLEMSGTHLPSIENITKGNLDIGGLAIRNTDIELRLPTRNKSNSDSTSQNEIFKFLKIRDFKFQNGNLVIKNNDTNLDLSNFTVGLSQLNFKPADLDNFLFTTFTKKSHIAIGAINLSNDKLKLSLNKLSLDNWKTVMAYDLVVHPATSPEPFQFTRVHVTEFDLDHFLHNEKLAFDTLIIDEPVVRLHTGNHNEENRSKLIQWAHHTAFKEVKIRNGQLTRFENEKVQVHLENFNAELSKFHFDSLRNEYYTLVGYRSDSIYAHLAEMDHILTGKDLSISIKDSTLHVKHLNFKPLSKKSVNQINVTTHELHLRQIDFHTLINQQQLHFYDGYLLSPKMNISLNQKEKKKTDLEKDLLLFNSLNVSNGQIHFENRIKDSSMVVDANHINVLINGFDLGRDSTIFSAKNYLADMQNLVFRNFGRSDSITVKRAFINTKIGHIKIDNLALQPSEQTKFFFPKIEVIGLDPEVLAHRKIFKLDSLKLNNPKVVFDLNRQKRLDSLSHPPKLPTAQIKNLSIANGQFTLKKKELNFGQAIEFENILLSIDELAIDSTLTLLSALDNLKNTQFSTDNLFIATPDSLYTLGVSTFEYLGANNEIVLHHAKLIPNYNRRDFQFQIDYQKDWLDMNITSIRLKNLDFKKLLTDEYIDLNELEINGLNLDTHRDKRLPIPPDKEKGLPQKLISDVPIPFNINKVNIRAAYISHSEYSPTGTLPGSIFFKNINGTISNVTNDSIRLAENRIMRFHTTGTMMNTGHFDVKVDFDLMDTTQFFYLDGTLKDMNLTEMNQLLEHTAFVHIKDGYNKYVTFSFKANHDYAIGEMKFYYEDLKITVLNPDDDAHKNHASSIKSFFANTFVVNKKNPHFLFVRQGDIFHHRDPNKAIFNYWAKALLSGVVSSIGAKNNKKEIRKLNEEMKLQLDQKSIDTLSRIQAESASN